MMQYGFLSTLPLNDSRSGLHENSPARIQRNPLQVWRIQSPFSVFPPEELGRDLKHRLTWQSKTYFTTSVEDICPRSVGLNRESEFILWNFLQNVLRRHTNVCTSMPSTRSERTHVTQTNRKQLAMGFQLRYKGWWSILKKVQLCCIPTCIV